MKSDRKTITPILYKVTKTIELNSMISSKDTILVGVSGGPDSVALLLLLIEIAGSTCSQKALFTQRIALKKNEALPTASSGVSAQTLCPNGWSSKPELRNQSELFDDLAVENIASPSIRIGIAHINHCLRGDESDRDEAFVKNLAQRYRIPFHTLKIDVATIAKEQRLSFEEAARNVRYSFYKEIASKDNYTKIALGHNCDDNAELVLMNILRGSGTKGIAGIPHVRDNWIIRPLIEVSREEILEYLRLKREPYVVDSSNFDTKYLRNKIRHSLIPHLKEAYNPSVIDSLNRLSRIVMDEESWMSTEAVRIFNDAMLHRTDDSYAKKSNCITMNSNTDNNNGSDKDPQNVSEIHLDLQYFTKIHPALAK
ncbi:MAG: tRNA lysidine(34) synthetase TilS, partial [Desulfamplus sp.]|nr:tRNA lysidine(34) synthetase TilS [Desulfamplus sp.]